MGFEAAVNERLQEQIIERERIGRLASALVEPGDVLMIDGGSTTIQFARYLAAEGERLTVLTNSLGVAATLGQNPSIKVVMCPGDYHPYEGIVTGPETITFLERFVVDKAFIGASGLADDGPSEAHSNAAWVKRRMLGQARQKYLLLDATKFNKVRHEKICRLAEIGNLVSDRRPKGRLRTALDKAAVTVHVETD
jgi:DeoR/GlpR family transcriptional regulator of sugar metabolism